MSLNHLFHFDIFFFSIDQQGHGEVKILGQTDRSINDTVKLIVAIDQENTSAQLHCQSLFTVSGNNNFCLHKRVYYLMVGFYAPHI